MSISYCMIRNLFLLSLSFFLRASILSAQNSTPSYPLEKPSLVTLDYSYFLSQIAAADLTHLYDLKMGEGSSSASLIRKGQPGEYSYSTLAGEDQNPISYLSRRDYQAYQQSQESNSRDQGGSFNESQVDDELKSNQVHFSSCSLILEEQGIGDGESGGGFSWDDALKTALTLGAIYLVGRALNHYIELQNDQRLKSNEYDSYKFFKDKTEKNLLRIEKIREKNTFQDKKILDQLIAVLKYKSRFNDKAHSLFLTHLDRLHYHTWNTKQSLEKYRELATNKDDSIESIMLIGEGISSYSTYNGLHPNISSADKVYDHLHRILVDLILSSANE